MPSTVIVPALGSISWQIRLTIVDLPDPDAPTRAVAVPAGIVKLTRSSAPRPPCPTVSG